MSISAYGLPKFSNIYSNAPSRRLQGFPSLRLKGLPLVLCGVFSQISTFLEQRRAFGHLTPSVDKDLLISYTDVAVPVKPPDPMVTGIDQPSLLHHATSGQQPISTSLRTIQLRHLFVKCSPCGI